MQRQVLILSDEHIGSYAGIGNLLARTLQAVGVSVRHMPLSAARAPHALKRNTVVIQNTIGPRFAPIRGCRNIAMVHHEWDRYPQAWVCALNAYSEVWVTTTFVKRTLLTSGVTVPIVLVRPALDLDPVPLKADYTRRRPLRIFACGAPHFRKGFHLLMEGFVRAFPRQGEAQLMIHSESGGEWGSPRPDILIDDVRLSREALLARFRDFDVFASASLGEGLGLPVAEAILAGVPVLANDWGGHGDLLSAGAFFPLPYTVVPQPYCSRPEYYAPGQRCAVSTVEGIAAALRRVQKSSDRAREGMAALARQALLRRYGQRAVTKRLKASRTVRSL